MSRNGSGRLALALLLLAGLVTAFDIGPLLQAGPNAAMNALVLWEGALPRLAISLLAGAALALCGTVFQQVMRNPLAEPATLGVSGGAYLGLAAAAVWAPGWLDQAREGVALAGAGLAMLCVLGLTRRQGLSPASMILAGLVVGLYCGAVAAALALLNGAGFQSLFLWASGSLVQNGWQTSRHLGLALLAAGPAVAGLVRPLGLLEVGTAQASGLGLRVGCAQAAAIVVATALAAATVAAAGVIGFVGVTAPTLARLAGARRFTERLIVGPLIGAALLALADAMVQAVAGERPFPTGAAVAVLGAPLLFALLPRLRLVRQPAAAAVVARAPHPWRWALLVLAALAAVMILSLTLGRGVGGWAWQGWPAVQPLLIWRAPRMALAMAAGAMLAVAGTLIQRMTGNPLASPEVLGVSSGAALGLILSLVMLPGVSIVAQPTAAVLGSLVALAALLWTGRAAAHAPDRILLGGITLATVFSGVASAFLASGDPRSFLVAEWLSGSTYLATPLLAAVAWGVTLVLGVAALGCARWLAVLPLGDAAARSLGVRLGLARGVVLVIAALLTAMATLLVGPLTFIGLLAPHAARLAGLARPVPQLLGAVLLAGLVMVAADWLGRILLFPSQLPAGLVATLLGTPYLLFQMRRR